jgi:hypothetical protein
MSYCLSQRRAQNQQVIHRHEYNSSYDRQMASRESHVRVVALASPNLHINLSYGTQAGIQCAKKLLRASNLIHIFGPKRLHWSWFICHACFMLKQALNWLRNPNCSHVEVDLRWPIAAVVSKSVQLCHFDVFAFVLLPPKLCLDINYLPILFCFFVWEGSWNAVSPVLWLGKLCSL